jgi:hypothetical protein|tara:strand:- start:1771 stop:1938 length:168 start_codon:yes stop_codon:yes gene_type:complete
MKISTNTKRSLQKQIGHEATKEIFDLLLGLVSEIETLKRSKVDVTKIVKDVDNNV